MYFSFFCFGASDFSIEFTAFCDILCSTTIKSEFNVSSFLLRTSRKSCIMIGGKVDGCLFPSNKVNYSFCMNRLILLSTSLFTTSSISKAFLPKRLSSDTSSMSIEFASQYFKFSTKIGRSEFFFAPLIFPQRYRQFLVFCILHRLLSSLLVFLYFGVL